MRKVDQPDTPQPEEQPSDIQRLGHQVASLAGVLVVALVEFGVPLTPGQQSSILSIIVTGWALASTVYGIRHRVAHPAPRDPAPPRHRTTSRAHSDKPPRGNANPTRPIRVDNSPEHTSNLQAPQ